MSRGEWTIDELVQRVADALDSSGVRAPNGRVTPLPDRRVIRWYATIGLLDRPVRTQGRAARYGERHLLQLVAVKRRQAEGRSLAEIQAELTGATDATLRRVAELPDRAAEQAEPAKQASAGSAEPAPARRQFWRTQPAHPVSPATAGAAPARHTVTAAATEPGTAAPASRFSGPPSRDAPLQAEVAGGPGRAVRHRQPADAPATAGLPAPVYPVSLPGGVTLVLPARPDQADLAEIHAAAEPLLDLLATRGLLATGALRSHPDSLPGPDSLSDSDSLPYRDPLSDSEARSPR